MFGLAFAAAIALAGSALAEDPGNGLIVKQSDFTVAKTLDRLGIALERKGIKVFLRINHAKGADGIGMDLPPTEVVIALEQVKVIKRASGRLAGHCPRSSSLPLSLSGPRRARRPIRRRRLREGSDG